MFINLDFCSLKVMVQIPPTYSFFLSSSTFPTCLQKQTFVHSMFMAPSSLWKQVVVKVFSEEHWTRPAAYDKHPSWKANNQQSIFFNQVITASWNWYNIANHKIIKKKMTTENYGNIVNIRTVKNMIVFTIFCM